MTVEQKGYTEMGKNLHYTILKFFRERMQAHSEVHSFRQVPNRDEFIFQIVRRNFGDTINVWLADQYDFDEGDFLNRPREIKNGDYILVARPEAHKYYGNDEYAHIGVGKIGEFMGALNKKEMWKYEPPTREEQKARAERSRRSM